MSKLIIENRDFMRQLKIDKCLEVEALLSLGKKKKIKNFVIGYTPNFVANFENLGKMII